MGEVNFKVPKNRLALSVVGKNRVFDGDSFEEDGWVYDASGKAYRKWFESLPGGALIWKARLNDPIALEQVCWRLVQRQQKALKDCWKTAFKKWQTAQKFWGRYLGEVVVFDGTGSGVGFRYEIHGCKKEGKERQDLVDLYFRTEDYMNKRHKAARMAKEALDLAVCKALYQRLNKDWERRYEKQYQVILNGRSYWYKFKGHCGLVCFCRPEQAEVVEF